MQHYNLLRRLQHVPAEELLLQQQQHCLLQQQLPLQLLIAQEQQHAATPKGHRGPLEK